MKIKRSEQIACQDRRLTRDLSVSMCAQLTAVKLEMVYRLMAGTNINKIDELNAQRQRAYRMLLAKEYRNARILFDQLFDGTDTSIAKYLGYIHSQTDSTEYDPDIAIAFYKVAASGGDQYSQHALGGLLLQQNNVDDAIKWFICASDQGNVECSYILAGLLKLRGDTQAAERYFHRAVDQGHALAIEHLAVRYIVGRYGLKKIWTGVCMYFRNLPEYVRYARLHDRNHARLTDFVNKN
jgi:TPR repeat protein